MSKAKKRMRSALKFKTFYITFFALIILFLVYAFFNNSKSGITGNAMISCRDSDGGLDFYTPGYVSGFSGFDDYCEGINLHEAYCSSNGGSEKIYKCPFGCKNGACIPKCFDNDFGKNYYTKGTVTLGPEVQTDYCFDCKDVCFELAPCPFVCKSLEEFFCQDGKVSSIDIRCNYGCEDGKCLQLEEDKDYQPVLDMLNNCHVESMLADKNIYDHYTGDMQCGGYTCIESYFSGVMNPKSLNNFTLTNTIRASCNDFYNGSIGWYFMQSVCCSPTQ
jgi:hypothetical protein